MMSKDTGGSAFPTNTENAQNAGACYADSGMTLRDYFAAKCCAAMVSTIRSDGDYTRLCSIAQAHDLDKVSQFFAQEAYKQADAMLAERAK
jgi:hypothetical protein